MGRGRERDMGKRKRLVGRGGESEKCNAFTDILTQ